MNVSNTKFVERIEIRECLNKEQSRKVERKNKNILRSKFSYCCHNVLKLKTLNSLK